MVCLKLGHVGQLSPLRDTHVTGHVMGRPLEADEQGGIQRAEDYGWFRQRILAIMRDGVPT